MANYFTSKRGVRIEVQSFPHLLPSKVQVAAEKKAAILYPATMPTYDEPLMGGGVQTFVHDEKSVEGNPEAKAQLEHYNEAMQQRTTYINEKMMQFYILSGTVVTLPTDNAWEDKQRFFDVEIPENQTEKLYHYITTELLVDARDIVGLVEHIMDASGIDKDTLDAARASFRGVLGEEENASGRTIDVDSGTGETSALVHLAPVPGNGSNGEVSYSPFLVG